MPTEDEDRDELDLELVRLTDDELRAVSGELGYRASLLFRLHRLGMIREPVNAEEAALLDEVIAELGQTPSPND